MSILQLCNRQPNINYVGRVDKNLKNYLRILRQSGEKVADVCHKEKSPEEPEINNNNNNYKTGRPQERKNLKPL